MQTPTSLRPSRSPRAAEQSVGVAAVTTTFALWGLVFVAPALAGDVPPVLLAGSRYLLHGAASLLLLRRLVRHQSAAAAGPGATDSATGATMWGRAALHGATGFVGYYTLLTIAIRTGGATLVVLVMAASPVVYLLAGRPGVPLRRLAAPVVVVMVGGVLAAADGPIGELSRGRGAVTVLLTAVAIGMWTWYGHDNARVVADPTLDLTRWTAMTGISAGLLSLPLVAFGLTQAPTAAVLATPTNAGVVLVLGLGCTTLANRTWNAGSRRLSPTVIGPLLVIEPVFALTYAHLLDGRVPDGRTLLGEVLLVGGAAACLLALRSTRRGRVRR